LILKSFHQLRVVKVGCQFVGIGKEFWDFIFDHAREKFRDLLAMFMISVTYRMVNHQQILD
jgi:hypothetical protein